MKLVVVSDNHMDYHVLQDILTIEYDGDYYLHLGDSEMLSSQIKPFVSVMGNNDFDSSYPMDKIVQIGHTRLFLCHGHSFSCNFDLLVKQAKNNDCELVLFGHTHEYLDCEYQGIRFLNPGSCRNNRDGSSPSYMIINITDNNQINVTRKNIKRG